MTSGIYCITNTVTGDQYVGSSKNCHRRLLSHMASLKRGKHSSKLFQANFCQYGEDAFVFEFLEEVEIINIFSLRKAETLWMQKLSPTLNIGLPRSEGCFSFKERRAKS